MLGFRLLCEGWACEGDVESGPVSKDQDPKVDPCVACQGCRGCGVCTQPGSLKSHDDLNSVVTSLPSVIHGNEDGCNLEILTPTSPRLIFLSHLTTVAQAKYGRASVHPAGLHLEFSPKPAVDRHGFGLLALTCRAAGSFGHLLVASAQPKTAVNKSRSAVSSAELPSEAIQM